jgi:hypothetical protein
MCTVFTDFSLLSHPLLELTIPADWQYSLEQVLSYKCWVNELWHEANVEHDCFCCLQVNTFSFSIRHIAVSSSADLWSYYSPWTADTGWLTVLLSVLFSSVVKIWFAWVRWRDVVGCIARAGVVIQMLSKWIVTRSECGTWLLLLSSSEHIFFLNQTYCSFLFGRSMVCWFVIKASLWFF